jgi:adhesin/invasin
VWEASLTQSTITAAPTSIVANGTSTSTITVQLKDASGTDLTVSGGVVTLATTGGTLSAVTDNSNGTYTATLTSSTTVGTVTVTGKLDGADFTDNATVDFTAPIPTVSEGYDQGAKTRGPEESDRPADSRYRQENPILH